METVARRVGKSLSFGAGVRAGASRSIQKSAMSVYPKQKLQVQFMTFGVDHHGISIPIVRRDKENHVHFPPATLPANEPVENVRHRVDLNCA
jgi:hypothetical protein